MNQAIALTLEPRRAWSATLDAALLNLQM